MQMCNKISKLNKTIYLKYNKRNKSKKNITNNK